MRVLCFAASLRHESLNRRLVELAARIADAVSADVDLADFAEFDVPAYNGDVDAREGLPPGAEELRRRLEPCSAVMISTPEYNYSIAGPLKNLFDWVSRARPMPWRGKSVYLMSASPGPMGGIRGLWQTRIPFEGCGALVFPDMFALAHANGAFKPNGLLADSALAERFEREIVGFVRMAEAVAPLCGKPMTLTPEQRAIVEALEEETELQPPSGTA